MDIPKVAGVSLSTDRLLREWLTEKLERAGLSQADLGRKLGIAPPQVAAWLDGIQTLPQEHSFSIASRLSLSGPEFLELHYIADTVAKA